VKITLKKRGEIRHFQRKLRMCCQRNHEKNSLDGRKIIPKNKLRTLVLKEE
jgi:hypothetical protein